LDQILKSLTSRHALLEAEIASERKRPQPDGLRVLGLKKMKLQLRDQIDYIRREGFAPVMVVRRRRFAGPVLKPAL
jgi:hypothetical protein